MNLPDWDFFLTYRLYGGADQISPYLHMALVGNKTVFIKSERPVGKNRRIWYLFNNYGYRRVPARTPGATPAKVIRTFTPKDFKDFNLERASEHEVEALGHFMCGAPLHGQWFGQLFEQMRILAMRTAQDR